MRYQVPQFLDIEDKIVGPLTFKQIIYVAGGIGIVIISFILIKPWWIAILIAGPGVALFVALAFVRVNNKPFVFYLQSMVTYLARKKIYTWKKDREHTVERVDPTPVEKTINELDIKRMSPSHLQELSWKLDTQTIPESERKEEEKISDLR